MSASLYWRPPHEGEELGSDLKPILEQWFGVLPDGEWVVIDRASTPFLRGVIAGAGESPVAEQARFLVKMIERHGSVSVQERRS